MRKVTPALAGQLAALNLGLAAAAVICYSPGLLNLRPGSESILAAGSSIFIGIVLIYAFIAGNLRLLKGKKKTYIPPDGGKLDLNGAAAVLKDYSKSKYFGSLAAAAGEQVVRLEKSAARAKTAVSSRFLEGSLSRAKYESAAENAADVLLKNLVSIAVRMQMFDEAEYARLEHYKEDDIPDDVQERQIALYQKNIGLIKDAVSANEEVLLALDGLSLELTSGGQDETTKASDALLEQVSRLTDEAKYYI